MMLKYLILKSENKFSIGVGSVIFGVNLFGGGCVSLVGLDAHFLNSVDHKGCKFFVG